MGLAISAGYIKIDYNRSLGTLKMDAVLDYSLLQGGIWRGGDSAREKGSVSLHKEDRDADNQLPPGVCFIFPRVASKG